MKRILHAIDWMSEWSGKTFSWLLLVTALIIGFEVFMRILGKPQIWTHDITLFTAGSVYFMGGAYTLLRRRHVKMDIFYVHLSPRKQALLDLLTLPGFVVFCGILFWLGGIRAWESFLAKETLYTAFNPPFWPVRWVIPISGLLILLQGLAKAIRDFHMLVRGERLD